LFIVADRNFKARKINMDIHFKLCIHYITYNIDILCTDDGHIGHVVNKKKNSPV